MSCCASPKKRETGGGGDGGGAPGRGESFAGLGRERSVAPGKRMASSRRELEPGTGADDAAAAVHVQTGDDADLGRVATADELRTLDEWNGKDSMAYPNTACLHDLFSAAAAKYPARVALIDGERQFTYAEVDAMTDRLASLLFHEHGVRPDGVVGILMERSAEYVLAYIAILKAGGAYMPLELVYPPDLLNRAIAESDAISVLTKEAYASRLEDTTHFLLSGDWLASLESQPPVPAGGFQPRPTPESLAYVVMSSGSTGVPKGICCPHRGAVHSYFHRAETYPFVDGDREACGVFFVWELLRPMLRGATTVVIPDEVLFNPEAVTLFLQKMKATRVLFTPSLLQLIVDSLTPEVIASRLGGLRQVWLCGEVVRTELANEFVAMRPDCELLNLYSISECHDTNICDLRNIDAELHPKYAPCGALIPNCKIFILNSSDMSRVGIGEPGEVFIGGPTLARGYLKMPEKTAERFVPSPFPESPGRLYRTGDLGRLLAPNGTLEIIGRCDFMVKIRGYSVVLGAVEAALAEHEKVASSVVVAEGEEGSDEKRLVAFVVPSEWRRPPSAAAIRAFLKTKLPVYAVPSVFIWLEALPVSATAAGKIDRKLLPRSTSPEAKRLAAFDEDDAGPPLVLPATPTETTVLEIWAEMLRAPKEEISCSDEFFDIGGHSLLATRVMAKLVQEFSLPSGSLTLAQLIGAPTVQGMAALVDAVQSGEDAATSAEAGAVIDLAAEAVLDPSIYPATSRKADHYSRFRLSMGAWSLPPRAIFLTGATGYLGAHILAEMLTGSEVTVFCLVRAESRAEGRARLTETLRGYRLLEPVLQSLAKQVRPPSPLIPSKPSAADGAEGTPERKKQKSTLTEDEELLQELLQARIVPVLGDLSKPLLGIENDAFRSLATEVDSILHCGADVNLVKAYASLKPANVLGTQEVLRLAVTQGLNRTKVKPVHHISTNSVFPIGRGDAAESELVHWREDEPLEGEAAWKCLADGYSRSKWVAEQLVLGAQRQRLPVSVLRPGNMAGSAATGAQNQKDFVFLFLQGCLTLGSVPDADMGEAYFFDLTAVDFAAKAAVHVAVNHPGKAFGKRMHLQNPAAPIALSVIAKELRALGHALEAATRVDWLAKLRAAAAAERKEGAGPTPLQELDAGFESFEGYFVASGRERFGCDNLLAALEGSGLECPTVGAALLGRWFPAPAEA